MSQLSQSDLVAVRVAETSRLAPRFLFGQGDHFDAGAQEPFVNKSEIVNHEAQDGVGLFTGSARIDIEAHELLVAAPRTPTRMRVRNIVVLMPFDVCERQT